MQEDADGAQSLSVPALGGTAWLMPAVSDTEVECPSLPADLATPFIHRPACHPLLQACIDNGVYGIFSLTGEEHPEGKNP